MILHQLHLHGWYYHCCCWCLRCCGCPCPKKSCCWAAERERRRWPSGRCQTESEALQRGRPWLIGREA